MRIRVRATAILVLPLLLVATAGHGQDEIPVPALDKPSPSAATFGDTVPRSGDGAEQADAEPGGGAGAGPVRAQLKPLRWTVLAAERAGRLERLDADLGDRLAKGETVVVFDCSELRAHRKKAEARLEGAQGRLDVYEKLDALESVSRLKVHETRTEVALAEAQLGIIGARLQTCRITVPYAAEVVERRAEAQQFVAEGKELIKLVDNTSLRLEAVVNSRWLSWLETGTAFRLALDELDRTVTGRVSRVGVEADPVSQTVKIMGTFEDLPSTTIAGMSGDVWFERPRAAH